MQPSKKILLFAAAGASTLLLLLFLLNGSTAPIDRNLLNIARQSGTVNNNYKPEYAFDNNPDTAWSPDSDEDGKYSWIEMEFTKKTPINAISMLNGYVKTTKQYGDLYPRNNRVKAVRIQLDDYRSYYWMLQDNRRSWQRFSFPETVITSRIRFYIHDIYPGNTIRSLFISEIRFH